MSEAESVYRAKPTQGEIQDVLSQRLTGAVATLSADGSIHLVYVIFLYEKGKIYWETASSTKKARNLAIDPTTSFLVDGTATNGTNLMVSVSGSARLVTGGEADDINHRLRAKYVTPEALPTVDEVWGAFDDIAVEVTPHRWRSWTNTAFTQATMAGFGDNPPDSVWRSD